MPLYMTHPAERGKKKGHKCFTREAWFPMLRALCPSCSLAAIPPILLPCTLPISLLWNFFPMVISLQVLPQPEAPHHHDCCPFSSAYLQVHPPPTATPPASHMSPEAPTTPLPPCFPHLGLFGCEKRHAGLLCWEVGGLVTQHQPGG